MILPIIQKLVGLMKSGDNNYFFDCGLSGYYNLTADEKNFPGVIYDFDSKLKLDARQSGQIDETYKPVLFFLFKSQKDWTMKQHSNLAITPAIAAAREFISLCQKDNDAIDSIQVIGDANMHFNMLNVNASGIEITFEIKLNQNASVCVAEIPNG